MARIEWGGRTDDGGPTEGPVRVVRHATLVNFNDRDQIPQDDSAEGGTG